MQKVRTGPTTIPEWLRPLVRVAKSGCWIWRGRVAADGYAKTTVARRDVPAHRAIYQRFHGVRLKREQQVCHKCDNRKCVRLDHLFIGSAADNSADMIAKGRQAFGARNGGAKFGLKEAREIIRRYQQGLSTQEELAKEYGVRQTTISFIVTGRTWGKATGRRYKKRGIGHPHLHAVRKHMRRGEAHHSTPLKTRDVKLLRRLRERGWTYERLGERFGISEVAARNIALRKTWRHV